MRYKCLSQPAKWVSAHRKNEYKFRLPQQIVGSSYNAGGYLGIILSGAFPYALNVGDRVYIPNNGTITGFHTIKSITSSLQFVLNTVANVSGSGFVIWQCYLPTVKIYKGYKAGELVLTYNTGTIDLFDIMPYELVAEFKPEVDFDGYVKFDICGYLKTVIESPFKVAYNADETSYNYPYGLTTYTPKYYNKVELILEDTLINTHYSANASITTDELNREFVDTQRQLQPLLMPVNYFGTFKLGDYIELNLLKAKYT